MFVYILNNKTNKLHKNSTGYTIKYFHIHWYYYNKRRKVRRKVKIYNTKRFVI